jgi:hydroxymethylbilane synthase
VKPWILGTRGSHLALAQSNLVADALQQACPDRAVELKIIQTKGDQRLDLSLQSTTSLDKGLFTKELETALAAREIDLAVHSLKDLPTSLPPGFALGAILPREDPADVLLTKSPHCPLTEKHPHLVATSSPRRAQQFRQLLPGCAIREIRGNVPTRLRKLRDTPELDGLILALAGLKRLGLADPQGRWLPGLPTEPSPPPVHQSYQPQQATPAPDLSEFSPLHLHPLPALLAAPGQGAIAVEIREDDTPLATALQALHCPTTAACVAAERALLLLLGGGCHLALGTLARPLQDHPIHLSAIYFPTSDSAHPPLQGESTGPADQPEKLAQALLHTWSP